MKNDAERGSLMKSDTDIPCVQLSTEQQATAIEAACKAANLDAHITRITAKSRAATWAEKIAARFKLDREDLVVKNSYYDPTAYEGVKSIVREENALDGRVSDLVRVLKFIIRNCGFELVSRIEIKDVKTGRVFK